MRVSALPELQAYPPSFSPPPKAAMEAREYIRVRLHIAVSSITMAELEFGIQNSSRPEQNRMALMLFMAGISILPFDTNAAMEYGDIRHKLKEQGMLIGGNDLLIAAHARSLGITLVTHNTREFSRVENLRIEDWAV